MEAASASDVSSDGPVLTLINKRIRALRKKLNRISQMEDSLSKGKPLNKEQEETLRTKPAVLAGIDELEKLRQPLAAAVAEEIELSVHRSRQSDDKADDESKAAGIDERLVEIEDLLRLLYFGTMFDVTSLQNHPQVMYSKALERGSCLSYDFMKEDDDDSADLLAETDLDLISMLSGLLISRPATSSLPHKDALERCIEHAKLWLEKSDHPIEPNSDVTYAGLRSKLNKILSSQYLTAAPVMNYGTYQVPVQELVPPVNVQVQAEDTEVQYQQKGESFSHEIEVNDSNPVEELHQEGEDLSGLTTETVAIHPHEGAEDPNDMKEQNAPQRSYHNYRGGRGGGGRRGSFNGRSGRGRGGTHQNGHNHQYNDHPGNYRSRNSNYRGRGGRGGRGGGGGGYYNNNNHGYAGQAGNYDADS